MRIHYTHVYLITCVGVSLSVPAWAQAVDTENWNAKFQTTYIWQEQPSFAAAYSGPHSLSPSREKSYSFTATAALGVRPWLGGELYFDPEVAQGVPLSHLTGLGGFTNGESARTAGPTPTFYRARLFLRQTWGLGGISQPVESDANQLAGAVDSRRWVLTAGNLSILDVFDNNAYSHDPRTQFFNWAFMTHGAYDYAADTRGYSWGAVLEYDHDAWAIRAGRFLQPKAPNQQALDTRIFRHYGDQIEFERDYRLGDQAGALRLLAYRNRAVMARYEDALAQAIRTDTPPDLNAVRFGAQTKRGIGLNLEQALSSDVGLFARAMWADGQTETYAFTEIDRSASTGLAVKGSAWGRARDTVGMAGARNALSSAHRDYLAAGGLGFFLGDGRLNYRPENIAEAYYALHLRKATWLTADIQYISNPGYNADRGPVKVGSLRLHTEF